MEACGNAHYWGREIVALGHEVRLVPPIYVKPFVKRHKNDSADAEAISEAAQRPTMHFVAVKTEAQQAQGMLFRTRDLLVRQRTQTINALRGHLAEFGVVAPQGRAKITQLVGVLEDGDSALPEAVVELGRLLLERIDGLDEKIDGLDRRLRASARPMESFRSGRDFSAWLGLVPRQHTTGGKPRLGRVSKMGQRDLRRLLGACLSLRWGREDGTTALSRPYDRPGVRCGRPGSLRIPRIRDKMTRFRAKPASKAPKIPP